MKIKTWTQRGAAGLAVAGLLVGGLVACSSDGSEEAAPDGEFPTEGSGELTFLNMTNYISEDTIAKFEADTGIKVIWDTTSGNEETTTKLMSGGANYDVVVLENSTVKDVIDAGILEEINTLDFPNGQNVLESARNVWFDEGLKFTAPYAYGFEAFGYDSTAVDQELTSWMDYFDAAEAFSGKINLHDSPTFVINAALRAVGSEVCTTDAGAYEDALDLLTDMKPKIKSISNEATADRLGSGDVEMSTMWNGSFFRAWQQKDTLTYVFPEEGYTIFNDSMVIPKGSPNLDNAKIFVNWYLDPENAALNSSFLGYNVPLEGIGEFQDEMTRSNAAINPSDEELARGESVAPCDVETREKYDRLWTLFKQ